MELYFALTPQIFLAKMRVMRIMCQILEHPTETPKLNVHISIYNFHAIYHPEAYIGLPCTSTYYKCVNFAQLALNIVGKVCVKDNTT